MLYRPILANGDEVEGLYKKLENTSSSVEQARIRSQLSKLIELGWTLSETAQEIRDGEEQHVVILDESSMVGHSLFMDLLELGVKVIAVGDPFQLPPVKDKPFLTADNPDVLLTEPHRQAMESGVYRLSKEIREGKTPAVRRESDCIVIKDPKIATADFMVNFDVVITGKHVNRRQLNTSLRREKGYQGCLPESGEKLICTKNNEVMMSDGEMSRVFNGQEVTVNQPSSRDDLKELPMELQKTHDPDVRFHAKVYDGHFLDNYEYDKDRGYRDYRLKSDLFEADFAHAITCHKAQGSEYPNVFINHDGFGQDNETKRSWLYTAVTRAQEGVVLYSPFI